MNLLARASGSLFLLLLVPATVAAFKSTTSHQTGPDGIGMQLVDTKENLKIKVAANEVPAPLPAAAPGGVLAVDAYKNVQVLGHISSGEFTRLMTAITTWVAPNQGCAYCHAPQKDAKGNIVKDEDGNPQADLARMDSDELYTKRVARRMIQMTMRLNQEWQPHVQQTGVTCYTCHRGLNVPANIWYDVPEGGAHREIGRTAEQNAPTAITGLASLPGSSLRPFLAGDEEIRVQSTEAIESPNRKSIKQTEWTYSLMMHMSQSLGVNCTYCHNSRSWGVWSTSPVTRTTAWYGIRMVREINLSYLEPLKPEFPAVRLGTLGDAPKANCATCHNGAFKPLLGTSMLKDYRVLAEAKAQPTKKLVASPVPTVDVPGVGSLPIAPDGGVAAPASPTGPTDAGVGDAAAGDAAATKPSGPRP